MSRRRELEILEVLDRQVQANSEPAEHKMCHRWNSGSRAA